MPFQPVPNTVECRNFYRYDDSEREYENIWHLYRSTGFNAESIDAIAESMRTSWAGNLAAYTPDDAKLVRCIARDLSTEFGYSATDETDVSGTLDITWASANNAALIRFIGAGGAAPRRGGIFFPFVPESQVSDQGYLTQEFQDLLEEAFAAYVVDVRGDVPGTSPTHVIVSRFERADPGPGSVPRDPAVVNPVVAYNTRSVVASQRDRRPKPI